MANEVRLIDANLIKRVIKEVMAENSSEELFIKVLEHICNMLDHAPTVDAVEVVHGRWIEKVDMVESYLADCTEVFYECSVCECANIGESPYCPNCGAKMDGDGNDI